MSDSEGKEGFQIVLWIGSAFVILGLGVAVLQMGGLAFFGPKLEAIRRNISEESRAHVTGTNQNLGRLFREYDRAEPAHRQGLRELIFIEADTTQWDTLAPHIRSQIQQLQGGN